MFAREKSFIVVNYQARMWLIADIYAQICLCKLDRTYVLVGDCEAV